MQSSETLYRRIAGEGATYIGLLLAVYDTLAADLRRAGQAVDRRDIAARCDATNHAFLLLGHLESWTDSLDDATLQASLRKFYTHLRIQALLLQANPQSEAFFELAQLVGETRAVWQRRETLDRAAANATPSAAVGASHADDWPEQPLQQRWSA